MPDLAIRAAIRHEHNIDIWNTPEWKANSKEYLTEYPLCMWCGNPSQVVHHPTDEYYGKPQYLNFHLCKCLALCNRCHRALHKGFHLCPRCRKGYVTGDNDHCRKCETPEEKALRLQRAAARAQIKQQIKDRQNAKRRSFYQLQKYRRTRAKTICDDCQQLQEECGKTPRNCVKEEEDQTK